MNITQTVGKTPLVKLSNIKTPADIFVKIESFNPLSSVKDRVALSIIDTAERAGSLRAGGTVVEASSGNTGIGLAFICAARGYKLILTMPDNVSVERRMVLKSLGAKLELTPGADNMNGAIDKALEIVSSEKNAFYARQFENPANPEIHRKTTGPEIISQMNGQNIDFFVSAVGTGGTITGTGETLKNKNPNTKIIAVEPSDSPVLSGGKPAPHNLQGIGAGFVPKILNVKIIDEIIQVTEGEAFVYARILASEEGIFAGITSGAAMFAANKIAQRAENKGKNIVVILPDGGDRYLSTNLWK
ncbi:MAG: cysteine synthase A [Elusimicrobium sp.]|jgi:cysteine synthase A|nr:cysteine synthase A [Elusimicrobium sp.]